ncbi:elongation factor P maturation arginine rhamnosyltransferase EarP [Janthinobacterium sp. BJB1]|uniref:elongation factor P maturation arginine rhamnosyltransferase EarP n=1 Tax=Janthinobacterium sp. GW458P TaxID=1981504 RepID=UPI000A326CD1|nr:elongation factor P maturation arginine rhamnosyltransferase EarP [Janthinobacterium sp. GW458P]MBE3027994.1 elongation factor P maturation arginine rhamnosyltransferase EarP [Janthinobacterium sp. GW458P]PHV14822.1 elongation factor P maturation arginine rhamnosyltransferase EarP [Janthinobacterium sp. BJB303]PJC96026.1 elongation factor P maturation arginine rhamnosyltransferase EarP [Janthinobacterium sp. BJB1]
MPLPTDRAPSLAIFCKVVDNYGDIGICWRLARQLHGEHGVAVTLWVDDLPSFLRICPGIDVTADAQQACGVTVRHWRGQDGAFAPADVADIVIEFFACDIPPGYIAAMAQRAPHPVWLNLEGLTAEEWVEGCHALTSPRHGMIKHFFFPGFTDKTGGLLREAALDEKRLAFQADAAGMAAFLGQFGVTPAEVGALKVSLFCYPHAPVAELFAAWQAASEPVACLVPEGVAFDAVQAFFDGDAAVAGAARTRGALTVRVLPFVPQDDYDRLLWACDVNFVRGEDSFVRAQWAGKPFIWHIYPQDENLHHVKLRAFLQRYAVDAAGPVASLVQAALAWNGAAAEAPAWNVLWPAWQADLPRIGAHAQDWQRRMRLNGDLASNLLAFASATR